MVKKLILPEILSYTKNGQRRYGMLGGPHGKYDLIERDGKLSVVEKSKPKNRDHAICQGRTREFCISTRKLIHRIKENQNGK